MSTLNIIGNGFDLYHGLPTNYYDFACYMLATDESLYTELAEMYDFPLGLTDDHTNFLGYCIPYKFFWRDFENKLGKLSATWAENTLPDDLGLETPEAVTLDVSKPDKTSALKRKLSEWIASIDTAENFQWIKSHLNGNMLSFPNEDFFVSFNYTHTLETIYCVESERILHIHGASSGLDDDDLIIGHGNEEEINWLSKKIEQQRNIPYGEYSQITRNRISEYSFERDILEKLKKPVDLGLIRLSNFLSDKGAPDYVCTYGLSFGEVDDPYFLSIRKRYPSAKWKFSYLDKSEAIPSIRRIVHLLNLSPAQYECFSFNNPTSNSIREDIIKQNNIVHYPKFEDSSDAPLWLRGLT